MRNKKFISSTLLSLLFFFSSSAFAHLLSCEIYDLATGQVLVESGFVSITSEDLQQEEPYTLKIEHILMNADFQLSFTDTTAKTLLFQIRTYEVVNSEFGKFTIPTSEFKAGKTYELGRVFTEITGYGDNTMSSCKFQIE